MESKSLNQCNKKHVCKICGNVMIRNKEYSNIGYIIANPILKVEFNKKNINSQKNKQKCSIDQIKNINFLPNTTEKSKFIVKSNNKYKSTIIIIDSHPT